MIQPQVKVLHPQPRLPLNLNHVLWAVLLSALILLLPTFAHAVISGISTAPSGTASTSTGATAAQLYSADPAKREQAVRALGIAAHGGSAEALTELVEFFQHDEYLTGNGFATASAIASAETLPAYQALIQGFRANPSTTRRHAAMVALETAGPAVTPLLIAALREDPDSGVRSTSAELLGYRHDLSAATALAAATHDMDSTVRLAAVRTLGGDLAVWNSLQRIQLLRAGDPDAGVRAEAQRAEDRIRGSIARALGIASEDLLFASVAPATGLIYAATRDVLYAVRDSGSWRLVSALPDTPTALAVGGLDGQVAYLGTVGSGPFRSIDGGQHWNQIRTGLPAAERLSVTSLVVTEGETGDSQQVTMGLSALFGTSALHTTPLGTFHTADGGNRWLLVEAVVAAQD